MNPIRRRRLGGQLYPMLAANFVRANSQSASIASNASLVITNQTTDFTIALWVNMTLINVNQGLAGKWGGSNATNEYLVDYEVGTTSFNFFTGTGTGSNVISATNFGPATIGRWNFVVAQQNSSTKAMTISVNLGTANSLTYTTGAQAATTNFVVGTAGAAFASAAIDCLGFWKSAQGAGGLLSAAQLSRLYKGGVGMAARDLDGDLRAALISYYDFDGNLNDDSGISVNHLTNNNGVTFVAGKR